MVETFNVQKFMEFQMGDFTDINACVKCAAKYSFGWAEEPDYQDLFRLRFIKEHGQYYRNLLEERINRSFAEKMDQAEDMLGLEEDPAAIKKFVIDAAMAEGLIKVEEAAHV